MLPDLLDVVCRTNALRGIGVHRVGELSHLELSGDVLPQE